jgi:hypothetical protein
MTTQEILYYLEGYLGRHPGSQLKSYLMDRGAHIAYVAILFNADGSQVACAVGATPQRANELLDLRLSFMDRRSTPL